MSISIGDIIAVGTLCKTIYTRCEHSRGEFRHLSIKASNLHEILTTIHNSWRARNISADDLSRLQRNLTPISELLRELETRLREYASLGRETPGSICDQIGWALKGGGAEFEKKLDSEINMLSLFLTSNLPRPNQWEANGLGLVRPLSIGAGGPIDSLHQQAPMPPMAANTTQSLSSPLPTQPDVYAFGLHSLWDGVRFLVFSTLSLICVAIILVLGSFFVIGLVFFPFAEIATGFARSASHWRRFRAFFGMFFNKVFGFVNGLWD